MKRIIRVFYICLLILIFTYIGINSFDEDLKPDNFTLKDLPPASFEKSNGFYQVFWLMLKEGEDPTSDKNVEIVKKLFSPVERDRKFIDNFDTSLVKGDYSKLQKFIGKIKKTRYYRT